MTFISRKTRRGWMTFRSADAGGGAGGGDNKPTLTLEQQLENARTEADAATKLVGLRDTTLAEKDKEIGRLQGLLDSTTSEATSAKGDVTRLTTELSAEKDAHKATGESLTKSSANVARLETLCGLKGIDPNQAVPPAPSPESTQTAESFQERLAAAKSSEDQMAILSEFQKAVSEGKIKKEPSR